MVRKQTIQDAKAFTLLRVSVLIACGLQVLLAQALSLATGRISPVTSALSKLVGGSHAQAAAWVVGVTVLCCVVSRRAKYYGAALYALYTFLVAGAMWQFNPLISALYMVYGIFLGVALMVGCRRADA